MVLTKEGQREFGRMLMPKPETAANVNLGWNTSSYELNITPDNNKPEKRTDYNDETLGQERFFNNYSGDLIPVNVTKNSYILDDNLNFIDFNLRSTNFEMNFDEAETGASANIIRTEFKNFNRKIKSSFTLNEKINVVYVININQK